MSAILVVEDDELIATALERELAKAGHEPLRVGTIRAAVAVLARADLVLCDLGLPDGDGLDLITHIAERWPALPVIAVTARADQTDVLLGLGSGAVDYLVKPFALAELLARVNAAGCGSRVLPPTTVTDPACSPSETSASTSAPAPCGSRASRSSSVRRSSISSSAWRAGAVRW